MEYCTSGRYCISLIYSLRKYNPWVQWPAVLHSKQLKNILMFPSRTAIARSLIWVSTDSQMYIDTQIGLSVSSFDLIYTSISNIHIIHISLPLSNRFSNSEQWITWAWLHHAPKLKWVVFCWTLTWNNMYSHATH